MSDKRKTRSKRRRTSVSSSGESAGQRSGPERPTSWTVRNLQRRLKVDSQALGSFLRQVSSDVAPDRSSSAALVLVGDDRMRALNRSFRGFDRATDVLAFPTESLPTTDAEHYLGDVVISVETAAREAKKRRRELGLELRVLALHGFLHLLGYDHETDRGEMRRLEYRLRRKYGITRRRTTHR